MQPETGDLMANIELDANNRQAERESRGINKEIQNVETARSKILLEEERAPMSLEKQHEHLNKIINIDRRDERVESLIDHGTTDAFDANVLLESMLEE